jgi:hypothetical protein
MYNQSEHCSCRVVKLLIHASTLRTVLFWVTMQWVVNLPVPSSGVKNSKEIMQGSTLCGSLSYTDAEVTIFLSNNHQLQPNYTVSHYWCSHFHSHWCENLNSQTHTTYEDNWTNTSQWYIKANTGKIWQKSRNTISPCISKYWTVAQQNIQQTQKTKEHQEKILKGKWQEFQWNSFNRNYYTTNAIRQWRRPLKNNNQFTQLGNQNRPEEADDHHDCTNYCKNIIRLNYFSYGRWVWGFFFTAVGMKSIEAKLKLSLWLMKQCNHTKYSRSSGMSKISFSTCRLFTN